MKGPAPKIHVSRGHLWWCLCLAGLGSGWAAGAVTENSANYTANFGTPWPQEIKIETLAQEYQRLEKQFTAQLCPAGTEEKFNRLFNAYLGNGHFVPANQQGALAVELVRDHLQLLQEKQAWIKKIRQDWVNFKEQKKVLALLQKLEQELKILLNARRVLDEEQAPALVAAATKQAQKHWPIYQQTGEALVRLIPFWLSFKFPLDHLALRETYDQLRQREDSAAADQLYLYRRTVQEGAPGRGHFMGRDLALRAGIDSWYLRLQQNDFWPQENDRYDAQFVVDQIRWRLKGNKARQTKLLREWEANTAEAIKFYQHLLSEKPSAVLAQDVLKTKARLELENFMAHKRQQIIAFWSGQSLVMQAVYAMETILFGEVGNLDPYGLERADVAQVILNRTAFEKYHQVESPLAPHEESVWSRILFKEGEFSFTYFFIPGSVRLFCFDQTKRGKHLRQQNVRIALQTLQNPRWAFKATRYFSRGPMIGHIDMAKLWPEYAALPEAAGKRIKDGALSKKLHQAWQQGRYDYWYTFTDAQGKKMQVIKVGKQPYVRALSPKKQAGEFYTYRNPQLFRYFALKESGLLMP